MDENNKTRGVIATTEIHQCDVMVLGNDFGTVEYVKKYDNSIGETDSKTINNLLKKINLDTGTTFFTNYYMGIRLDDGLYKGTTMIKRMYEGRTNKLRDTYKNLCKDYFIVQINLLKPRVVICLGHEVKNALISFGEKFHAWKSKSDSIEKLYHEKNLSIKVTDDENLGTTTFVVIPHPCYIGNLKSEYIEYLCKTLKTLGIRH